MGATDEEITLDFLLVYGPTLDERPIETVSTTIHNFKAARDITNFY